MSHYSLRKASDLAGDERLLIERWLGRSLAADETISVNAYRPHAPSDHERDVLRGEFAAKKTKTFTEKQGQYLAFIYHYCKMNRRAPAETDLERYFRVSAPSIHDMILRLEAGGFIERTPGVGRSMRLLVPASEIPPLK